MAVEKSYARLGLFVVIVIVVILATALLFIQRMRSQEVIELVTYTQENVAGLDISSPVRYRGVALGRVSNVLVVPGGRTIEIDFELFSDRLTSLGASVTNVTNLQELARSGRYRPSGDWLTRARRLRPVWRLEDGRGRPGHWPSSSSVRGSVSPS